MLRGGHGRRIAGSRLGGSGLDLRRELRTFGESIEGGALQDRCELGNRSLVDARAGPDRLWPVRGIDGANFIGCDRKGHRSGLGCPGLGNRRTASQGSSACRCHDADIARCKLHPRSPFG